MLELAVAHACKNVIITISAEKQPKQQLLIHVVTITYEERIDSIWEAVFSISEGDTLFNSSFYSGKRNLAKLWPIPLSYAYLLFLQLKFKL